MAGVSKVEQARRRIQAQAERMGWLVTRETRNGVVMLTLLCLVRGHAAIRYIEIVPDALEQPDPGWCQAILESGLDVIPARITPRQVPDVLRLLTDLERSIA
jgi:hypothetical protein